MKISIKRVYRFRLRTFLVLFLLFSGFFAWVGNAKINHERELKEINKLLTPDTPAQWNREYKLTRQNAKRSAGMELLGASM